MEKNFNIAEWRRRLFETDLTATEKLVALALANYFTPGHPLYPSIPIIAKSASLTERAVYKAINNLKEKHIIAVERKQVRKAKLYHNNYTLLAIENIQYTPEPYSPTEQNQIGELRSQIGERIGELGSQIGEYGSQEGEPRSANIDINIDKKEVKKILLPPKAVSTDNMNFFLLPEKRLDELMEEIKKLSPTDKRILTNLNVEDGDLKEFIGNCCSVGIKESSQQIRFMLEATTYWGEIQRLMSDRYNTDIPDSPTLFFLNLSFSVAKDFLLGMGGA